MRNNFIENPLNFDSKVTIFIEPSMASAQNSDSESDISENSYASSNFENWPDTTIEEALAKPNVDLNDPNVINGESLLHAAIRQHRTDIVKLLIDRGADVTIETGTNQNPFDLVEQLIAAEPNNSDLNSIRELLENAQPGTSSMHSKGTKRPIAHQNDDQNKIANSKLVLDPNITSSKRFRIDNEYKASGLKLSLHGVVFQLKLLMLCTHRATKNGYKFRLGTEMDRAEKFDDVVLEYFKSNESLCDQEFCFVQAKHKNDSEKNKITIGSLESEEDDFSLQKYLISFCKIKNRQHFAGSKSSKFFIVTNTDFHFLGHGMRKTNVRTDKWRSFIEEERDFDADEILYFDSVDFAARKYRLRDNADCELKNLMKLNLLKSVLKSKKMEDLHSVSDKLNIIAKLMHSPSRFNESKDKFNELMEIKDEDGIGQVTKKDLIEMANGVLYLKEYFFGNQNDCNFEKSLNKLKKRTIGESRDINEHKYNVLNEAAKLIGSIESELEYLEEKLKKYTNQSSDEFRLIEEDKKRLRQDEHKLKEKMEQISKCNDLQSIKTLMKADISRENLPQKVLREISNAADSNFNEIKQILDNELANALERIVSETLVIELALDDAKFHAYCKDFLDGFRFVTNFPNEEKLGALIAEELGDKFNLLNADLVSASFEREMLDFFKSYHKGTAEFYTRQRADDLFGNLAKLIDTLMISGLSRSYPEKLRQYGIRFNEDLVELHRFLANENQIFHLVTQSTRLGAIKVLQTLDATEQYQKEDSVIFMRFRTLLRKGTQKHVLSAFSKRGTYDLIVIEIQQKVSEDGNANAFFDELSILIRKLLENRPWKKIIVIDSKEHSHIFKYQTDFNRIFFQDFDENSQNNALDKEVNFQGTNVRLNQLMDIDSAHDVLRDINMACFLDAPIIYIGDLKAFTSIGYVEDCYIERRFRRRIIKEEVLREKSELFFITGASRAVLTRPWIQQSEIMKYQTRYYYDRGIIIVPLDQSDRYYEEIFETLGPNAHWLEYHYYWRFCGFIWRNSKKYSAKVAAYTYKDNVTNNEFFRFSFGQEDLSTLDEAYFSRAETSAQKIWIVANDPGMGKSTVLTSLARKMKGFDGNGNVANDRWIVRINLNEYAELKVPQSLNKIDFQECDTGKAIEFLTKMAIPDDSEKGDLINLQQSLFKATLNGSRIRHQNECRKPKIVLMFDGFDEITPFYKEKTTTLIKALKASQVTQMWITTRVHEKAHLEQELETPALILVPLSENDQMEFSSKLWKWNLKFRKDSDAGEIYERYHQEIVEYLRNIKLPNEEYTKQLNESISKILEEENDQVGLATIRKSIDDLNFFTFIRKLMKNWKKSIADRGIQFTVNPLQLKMLTEVIFAKRLHLPKDFGLFDLYDEFIQMKFAIYYDEKENRKRGNQGADESRKDDLESAHKIHCALAVKLLLPEECKIKPLPNFEKFNRFRSNKREKEQQKLARKGLVCLNEGRLEFIHRSFAEYFLTKYLIDNIANEVVQQLLLPPILTEDGYKLIREFFNGQLQKTDTSIELKRETKDLIYKCFSENKMLFRSYVADGHHGTIGFVLEAMQANEKLLENLLTQKYDRWDGNILEYAVDHEHTQIVKQLLGASHKLRPDIIKNVILKCESNENLLSKSIEKGNHEIVDIILNFARQMESLLGKGFLMQFVTGPGVENAVINAVLEKKTETVKCVIKTAENIDGENMVMALFRSYYAKSNGDEIKLAAHFCDCIMDDPVLLNEFVLQCDQRGKSILLNVIGVDFIHNAGEFVSKMCEYMNDSALVEDLAILSVFGAKKSLDRENLKKLLNLVDSGTKLHTKLVTIETNLSKIKRKRKDLDQAIRYQEILEMEKIWSELNDFEFRQIMFIDEITDETLFHTAVDCRDESGLTAKYIARLKSYPKILKAILLKVVETTNETALQKAIRCGNSMTPLNLLNLIRDHFGVGVLKRVLLKPSNYSISAIYEPQEGKSDEQSGSKPNDRIFQWVTDNLGPSVLNELIKTANTFSWFDRKVKRDDCISGVKGKLENIRNHPEISMALALETNYFGQTTLHIMMDEKKYSNYFDVCELRNAYLESIKHPEIFEDLAILSVYGDGRTNPSENIRKLLDSVENSSNYDEIRKRLNLVRFNLDDVQHKRAALDEAIRQGNLIKLQDIFNQNQQLLKELLMVSNEDGKTVLHLAAQYDQCEIVHKILEMAEQYPRFLREMVLKVDKHKRETVLHLAARNGHHQSVLKLLNFLRNYPVVLEKLLLKPNARGLS